MTDAREGTLTKKDARADLVEALRSELIGPAGGETEELTQRPTSRYLLGRLAPLGTMVDPNEDDGAGEAAADGDDADFCEVLRHLGANRGCRLDIALSAQMEFELGFALLRAARLGGRRRSSPWLLARRSLA